MKRGLALAVLSIAACKPSTPEKPLPNVPALVAHAGGGIGGEPLSNTREALDAAYAAGYRWFEVDFSWTSDDQLVCVQNWGEIVEQQFGATRGRKSLADFHGLKRKDGRTPLTLTSAMEWLAAHPEAVIVTDAKEDNLKALEVIAKKHTDLLQRIIAQAYDIAELEPAANFDFKGVIFSLYQSEATDEEVLAALAKTTPLAVAMTPERARTKGFVRKIRELGLPVYVHTVNDKAEWQSLMALGVTGVYSDTLEPKDLLK
jgi:glycerophosphoryl diester phosphodiesterase